MASTNEKFGPNSFLSDDKKQTLVLSHDLTGLGYYTISPSDGTDTAPFYLIDGNESGTFKLKKQGQIKRGELFLVKSYKKDLDIFYGIVLSGERKFDQGWVRLNSIGNINPQYIPTDLPPPVKTVTGKVDLITSKGLSSLFSDSSGNKNKKTGALSTGIPLKRITKKNNKYIKVKILAGTLAGKTGYVERSLTKKPTDQKDFDEKNYKTLELSLEKAFATLNEEFALPKIKEVTGLSNITLKDPTSITAIQRGALDKLRPSQLVKTNICFYNEIDKTLDFMIPFYFGPATADPATYQQVWSRLSSKPDQIRGLYIEPQAKAQYLVEYGTENKQYNPNLDVDEVLKQIEKNAQKYAVETLADQIAIYKEFSEANIIEKDLAIQTLTADIENISKSCSQFMKITPSAIKDIINSAFLADDITILKIPNTVNAPRWGYFVCKIEIDKLESVMQPFVEPEAANTLVDYRSFTSVGLDEIHLFLRTIPDLVDNVLELSINVSDVDKRIKKLRQSATRFQESLDVADKEIYAGTDEKSAQKQKPVMAQFDTLQSFSTFLKASLITGRVSPTSIKSVEDMGVRLIIKADKNNHLTKMSVISLSNTSFDGTLNSAIPTINNINSNGEDEIVKLHNGKTSLLEKQYYDLFSESLSLISLPDFGSFASQVEKLLNNKKEENIDDVRYLYEVTPKPNKLRNCVIYILAEIIRQAAQKRQLDLGTKVPATVTISEKVNGKIVPISDFSKLTGPFIFGKDNNGKLVSYTPDYQNLLRQFSWLAIDSKGQHLSPNWSKIGTKPFIASSNNVISRYSKEEYSIISCLNSQDFSELKKARNFRTFFDRLYKYNVFYKEKLHLNGTYSQPNKAQMKSKMKQGAIVTVSNKTPTLDRQLLEQVLENRYTITEQAFGGSGCLEFAIKGVNTFDDLYKNVMHKANWSLFLVQAIDRFKCELSKMGGGDLACLADFDVMGTYSNALDAKEVVENFPKLYEQRLKEQPLAPILGMIYNRKIPKMPSIDWYACLRGFLISLLMKVVVDLTTAFIQATLSALNIQCGADFSKCQQSEIDPLSSDLPSTESPALVAEAAAAGLPEANANKVAEQLRAINLQITGESVSEFIRFLASEMPIVNFKALLNQETPLHIFNHGKFLANNFFQPIKFTDEQFRLMMDIINQSYEYEAFIAATLFEQIQITTGTETCPPGLVDGNKTISDIKEALREKLKREKGSAADADATLKKNTKEIEDRVSAFCKVLSAGAGVLKDVKSAPSLLASYSNYALSNAAAGLITQLRVKSFYDYYLLKYMFTGDLAGNNPDKEDIVRADLSLAFNVVYSNYLLNSVKKDDGSPEKRSFRKQYDLTPQQFINEVQPNVLKNDSFETEFTQDILKLVVGMNPLLFPFYPVLEQSLFKAPKPLDEMDRMFLGASRDLNNPNYFYAWAENLLALIPFIDPRRFPAKYPDFVEENYPNAIDNTPINAAYVLESSKSPQGLLYKVTNGNEVLLEVKVGLDRFEVLYNSGETNFVRDLPKLSEPFFIDDTKDYKTTVNKNQQIIEEYTITNPQKQIFSALAEKNLKAIKDSLTESEQKKLYPFVTASFDTLFNSIEDKLKEELENAPKMVSDFFFKPYIESAFINLKDVNGELLAPAALKSKLLEVGNPKPPVVLFFERSNNLFSEVFYEDTITEETAKIMDKIQAALKSFTNDAFDGKEYNPKAIESSIQAYQEDSQVFYDVQSAASVKLGGPLYSLKWTSQSQEKILEAVKEVLG